MNRNVESRFALAPSVGIGRSRFKIANSRKTSFNVGRLIPFYFSEVLPGDTFDISTNFVARLQTLITPLMDNVFLDYYFFYVPNRLVWTHWKNFMGENTESAWLPETEYEIPQISSPEGGFNIGTLADHFEIPTGVENLEFSSLPFRAYAKIVQDWFRDENLTDPLLIPDGDSDQTGSNGDDYITDIANGGMPFLVSKYHDYFTSALPAPQKGPDVPLPVAQGTPVSSFVPVVTGDSFNDFAAFPKADNGQAFQLSYGNTLDGSTVLGNYNYFGSDSYAVGFGPYTSGTDSISLNAIKRTNLPVDSPVAGDFEHVVVSPTVFRETGSSVPLNLVANLSDYQVNMTVGTINELRSAFQIQKYFERDARSGSRYIEIIKSHFGVTSPDARLQRSEYLGGARIPLNINQVIQTSSTDSTTPQGNVSGQSVTADSRHSFKQSFTEHGMVIGLAVVRYNHSYQQGLPRSFSRKSKFDFYFPEFANIGEQAILNKEIYAQGSLVLDEDTGKAYDDEVFGYQEAWADYRYKPSSVTGQMRSQAAQSLDPWHLGDDYSSLPYLSDDWIREDKSNVDRALAVTSEVADQIFADFYIVNMATRPMPLYSIPGLIDHH